MAHAERIDETVQRNPAPSLDRCKQVAHGRLAVAFNRLQLQPGVALGQREDIGGLLHPSFVEEKLDLLLAEPLDVEGAARDQKPEMFALLGRAREPPAPAGARALLSPPPLPPPP